MKKIIVASAAAMGLAVTTPASAAVFADDLAKCLVAQSTDAEKTDMVRWIFGAISAHPAVKSMTNVTAAQRQDLNRRFAALVQQLAAVRCRAQTVAALKNEGPLAFQTSFGVLGQVAMRGLMSDAAVVAELSQLDGLADAKVMGEVYKEAGIAVPAKPK